MSIQDESFPVDEFLDELDFSPLAVGQRFQFPHYQREQKLQQQQQQESKLTTTATNVTTTHASSEQNLSSESNHERPPSGLSSKTSASDADENASKNPEFSLDNRTQSKAISYQDIHSEYTKRRFKHVASKVGQYIANMKADEQKRREAKFERHRSMPDTLSGSDVLLNEGEQKRSTLRYSVDELQRDLNLNISNSDDADGDVESAANTSATTSASAATTNNNNNSDGRHESSDNVSGSDFVDKQTFALLMHEKERIQSYSEYLQTKLDEKSSENMRLKRNVDFMRIELSNCQDKLKQKEKEKASSKSSRLPLLFMQSKFSKATQTDLKTPSPLLPPRDLYITPDTPDANNNNSMCDASTGNAASKPGKTVATIQPLSLNFSNIAEQDSADGTSGGVLRQRTNSNTVTQHNKPINNVCALTNKNNNNTNNKNLNNNNSRSSSDSAIDIESVELSSSSKLKSKQQQHRNKRNNDAIVAHTTQSLDRAEEFIYYDKRTGRYATLQALNVGAETTTPLSYDENNESSQTAESTGSRKSKKHHSLRRRWLRIFGHCTRCSDPHALDNSALQQTYTQIPLLEKSIENHCRNIR